MWQRFSESARKAIFYAQEESTRQGHNAIIPDHLLLGLLVEEDTLAFRTLTALGVDIDAVRNEVRRRMKPEQGLASADMTLTLEGKKVIDLAYREAQALNNNYVGTEHMLLGVLSQGKSEGAEVLTGLGVHPDAARREAVALQIREDRRTQDTGIHWSSLD
ncbi:NDP-hexose 4-ketoreductase, partial [bacterium]